MAIAASFSLSLASPSAFMFKITMSPYDWSSNPCSG